VLVAVPVGVATEIRPEPVLAGTLVLTCEAVALLVAAYDVLTVTRSFAAMSKSVPLMATAVPLVPMLGVKPVMVGPPELARTVKFVVLDTDPDGVVTVIGPVVAVLGTVTMSCVALAEVTAAETPLKLTPS